MKVSLSLEETIVESDIVLVGRRAGLEWNVFGVWAKGLLRRDRSQCSHGGCESLHKIGCGLWSSGKRNDNSP